MTDRIDSIEFSIADARAIVKDLFEPKPWIYWADFLFSTAIGVAGTVLYLQYPPVAGVSSSLVQSIGYTIALLAFYRTVMFTHELVHLKSPKFAPLRVAWNVLCGIPFLIPTFTYYTHVEHHSRKHYGTEADGEYLPLAVQPIWHVVWYMSQPLFIPALAVSRFLLFAPLGWSFPALRRRLHQHASSMVMDPTYSRPLPSTNELRVWHIQETACFLYCLLIAAAVFQGQIPLEVIGQGYLLAVGVLLLNQIRTLGAHRFVHTGRELTFVQQLLDSVNYPKHPLITGLWAPVGLRYHALHHLFPSLPYHALDQAHCRLMAQLPANSLYRRTNSPGFLTTMSELLASAWQHTESNSHARNEVERGSRPAMSTSIDSSG